MNPREGISDTFAVGTRLYIRVLAVALLCAFLAFWIQAPGLIGAEGVQPAGAYLERLHAQFGPRAYVYVPTLCWIFGTGACVPVLCAVGVGASLLLLLQRAEVLCLAASWICYLSLCGVGQVFYEYQWDALLLEATLLAVFLVPWRLGRSPSHHEAPALARYLSLWLLFRLMFFSGVVKLASGDPNWRNLTALAYHFRTQPLPSPVAWYANQLPGWLLKASCAAMFAIEFAAPVCLLLPRRVRHMAALSMVALQAAIALTGSYAYFNLLSAGLCALCVDDRFWEGLGLRAGAGPVVGGGSLRRRLTRWFAAVSVGLTFFLAVASVVPAAGGSGLVRALVEIVGPLRSFNSYGLFAVMTVERPELVVEGSDDGHDWTAYELPFKPGNPARMPRWAAPYQPRLDWQLWFAGLEPPDQNAWLLSLCEGLLRGRPQVLALFSHNPFADHPPRYVRVVRYLYEFTDPAARERSGYWWRRSPVDLYIEPVSLKGSPR